MKIVLVISSLGPGGAERVLSNLATHWVRRGHAVTLITLDSPSSTPFYTVDPGITLEQLDCLGTSSSVWKRLAGILRRLHRLRRTIKRYDPDVVVSFVDVMNVTTLLATLGLGVGVIACERIDPTYHHLPRHIQKLRLLIYRKASHVLCQTPSAASYFRWLRNVTIIPNPVRRTNPRTSHPKEVRSIISIGRLCHQKDFRTLIKAFSNLAHNHPHLTLTIYGEGQDRPHLQTLVSSLNLKNKVILPGTTPDVGSVLVLADLFILPSLYEGFPNALCEAMAAGLPVIASACSGNTDIVRDGIDGRLFPVGDVDALTALMAELLGDAPQRRRLGRAAQDVAIRFHPDKIYAQWDAILEQAMGNK